MANKYIYRAKPGHGALHLNGPYTAEELIKQFQFPSGDLQANISNEYEIFELVPARIVPPNEAKVVRA